jgi:hypothetical protein
MTEEEKLAYFKKLEDENKRLRKRLDEQSKVFFALFQPKTVARDRIRVVTTHSTAMGWAHNSEIYKVDLNEMTVVKLN